MAIKIPGLKPKEAFEVTEFVEKAGMISIYKCTVCEKLILFTYIASGITPIKLICQVCGNPALVEDSVEQPDRIWYRPEDINELKRLALLAYDSGIELGFYKDVDPQETIDSILRDYVIHYNNGRLFAKMLNPKT
jgi:hypothetical protein